jgi:hypothetical protein
MVNCNIINVNATDYKKDNITYSIKGMYSDCLSYNEVRVGFKFTNKWDKLEIYRATSKKGKYSLLDSINSGGQWQGNSYDPLYENTSVAYTKTTNKKKTEFWIQSTDSDTYSLIYAYFIDKTPTLEKQYYYKICYYYDDNNYIDSSVIGGKSSLDAPIIYGGYYSSKNKLKLRWQLVDGAQGYYLYKKDGKKWKKIKTIGKNTKSITVSANQKKTHYYTLVPYRKVNGKKVTSKGYSYKVSSKLNVKGTYKKGTVYGSKLNSSQLTQVKQVVQGFKDNFITSKMSDYDKVLSIFNYLQANVTYAETWKKNNANTAWGSLVYGEAQCSGYARGVKALCDAVGIKCYYVHANSKSWNPDHQWNVVKVKGKWYILDAQGGAFLVSDSIYGENYMEYPGTKGVPKCKWDTYTMAISESKLELNTVNNKTYTLSVSGTSKKITWSSSNKKVATVSSKGKVTAKGKGTATITAKTSTGDKVTCKVTVKTIKKATKVKLNKNSLSFEIGKGSKDNTANVSDIKPIQLTAKVTPTNATYKNNLYWESSNEKVATVDKKGKVTIKGKGNAKISCYCYYLGPNTDDYLYDECEITVTNVN